MLSLLELLALLALLVLLELLALLALLALLELLALCPSRCTVMYGSEAGDCFSDVLEVRFSGFGSRQLGNITTHSNGQLAELLPQAFVSKHKAVA